MINIIANQLLYPGFYSMEQLLDAVYFIRKLFAGDLFVPYTLAVVRVFTNYSCSYFLLLCNLIRELFAGDLFVPYTNSITGL